MLIIICSKAAKFRPSFKPIYHFAPNFIERRGTEVPEAQTRNIGM